MELPAVSASFAQLISSGTTIRAIKGTSSFSSSILNQLITEKEEELHSINSKLSEAENAVNDRKAALDKLTNGYKQFQFWANVFNNASMETKKMIIDYLIKKVTVMLKPAA